VVSVETLQMYLATSGFDYIEMFFNRRRLHSTLNYVTPVEYETKISNHTTAHAA
jgi:transposase InsO family protein